MKSYYIHFDRKNQRLNTVDEANITQKIIIHHNFNQEY